MRANFELDAGAKTFASGLLAELIAVLHRTRPGDLVAVISAYATVGAELETWCRFTRNSLVDMSSEAGRNRWVIRCGEAPRTRMLNVRSDRDFGSTRILTATYDVITAACAPHPQHRGGHLDLSVCGGSQER